MELTLLAPTALSAACSKALAFWAAAGPTAGPSMRADITTNVTNTFFISILPKSRQSSIHSRPQSAVPKGQKLALRLSQQKNDGTENDGTRFNVQPARRCLCRLEIHPETPVSGWKDPGYLKLVYDNAGLASKPNRTCCNEKY